MRHASWSATSGSTPRSDSRNVLIDERTGRYEKVNEMVAEEVIPMIEEDQPASALQLPLIPHDHGSVRTLVLGDADGAVRRAPLGGQAIDRLKIVLPRAGEGVVALDAGVNHVVSHFLRSCGA